MGIRCPRCQAENPSDSKYCKECATALTPPADVSAFPTQTIEAPRQDLATGTLFASRYKIVEELGGGGMGKVFRAHDTKVGEEIAIKLIKPEIAADRATIERFKNELKIARKVVHKSVGRVYDLNEDRGTFYITMEYVRGDDLKAFIRSSGQMAVGTSLRVARQVAEGLAEAHELGIVHRDLKPSNIMIDRQGNARIMDFGIARLAGAKGITGGNVMIGTPEYMSPEQVEGKEAGAASDIYSLGIVLFEMLTGRLPFEGETPLSIAVKQKSEAPPDPRTLNPEIPEGLNRVIRKCLEKSKEKRYRTAAEFLADLAGVEKSLPTTPHPLPVRKPLTSKEITVRLPSKKVWIPVAAVLVALLAFAVWQFIPEGEGAKRTIAVIGFKNQTGEADLDYLREAIPHLLITSLGESKRLKVTSWERMKDLLRNTGRDAAAIFDEEAGFDACRREGIEAIILGSFVKAGETFATDVQVLDASSKHILKSASAKGDGVDSILKSQIDEISRTIRRGIALPPLKIETPARKIIDLTTSSMEAYNYYLQAQEAYDNFFYAESRKYAEQAVAVDPAFAIAYFVLSQAAGQLYDYPARNDALEKAKTFSANATEKERLVIEARYANIIERDRLKRIRLLEELVEKYPEDKQAHSELGMVYSGYGHIQEAVSEFEKAIAIDPRFGYAVNQVGYEYARMGDFAKAVQSFERYAELNPGLPNPIDSIAEMNMFMGKLDEAVAKYHAALAMKPDFYQSCGGLAYTYALKEDYAETERWVDEFIRRVPTPQTESEGLALRNFYDHLLGRLDRSLSGYLSSLEQLEKFQMGSIVAYTHLYMGFVYIERGEFDNARKALQVWMDDVEKRSPSYLSYNKAYYCFVLGLIELKQGRLEAAKVRLTELEGLLPNVTSAEQEEFALYRRLLEAEVALAGNSLEQAIRAGEKIEFLGLQSVNIGYVFSYNIPFQKDVLARAYWKKGDLDKAIAEYERLTTIDPKNRLRMLISPLYHYRFGRVLEEKGERDRAGLEYEKFLKCWANADPRFVELKDARARLAALVK
ncbi:MAG: protein kinase [Candidatus Aminicenantes bacterium]|nr:protein kinase [Candidatus Aminicenantes bacterium]